ncbi:MAG: ABC transporter permease [Spiroplasma sp. hy2]|uniref:ABC transporter permease n=1 Tax=Spiroplasma sp. hy2 TaxID=2490850 RepID=UPI00383EF1C7
MKSNDIKILKIKPIKQSAHNDQSIEQQEFTLNNDATFFLQENSHFFKNNYFFTKTQNVNQNSALNSFVQSRKMILNLDNPNALKILYHQTEKLQQEKTSFHHRLNKIKSTFDEKIQLDNEEHLYEPPTITKNIDLLNFNKKNNDAQFNNEPVEVKIDHTKVKAQARAVAQKIMQKDQEKLKKSLTNIDNKQTIKSKSVLTNHFPKLSLPKSSPQKDVFFTQSYNKIPGQKINVSQKITHNMPPIQAKNIEEETYNKKFDNKQNENKKTRKEVDLIVRPDKGNQFYDEIDTMEWDITKRPNLGVEQTTNKYYHQEEKNLETKKVSQVLSEKVKLQDETSRAIELEEAEGTYQIDNFYAKLFNSNVKEDLIKQGSKLKIKQIGRRKAKNLNPNVLPLTNKDSKSIVQATTMFNNNYQIKQLPNGRQRITKIKKNNILKWRDLIVLIARLMAIIGLIVLCSAFLVFNNWINNSALDLYNFFVVNFGKINFITVNHHYFFVNRIFMLILIGIYAITVVLPFCLVSNFKIQLYCFLPLSLLFLCSVIAIALYSYFFMNNIFNWSSNIMQIISYSFLLLANILMLAAVLKRKKERS